MTPSAHDNGPDGARIAVLSTVSISGFSAGVGIILCTQAARGEAPMWALGLVAVAMIGVVTGLMSWAEVADPKKALTVWHGVAAAFAGGGAGVLVTNLRDSEQLVIWFGLGCLLLAVLTLLLGITTGANARHKVNLAGDLIRTGVEVPAVVLDRGYVEFGESTQINTPVRFGFTDKDGVEHTVEKRLMILPDDPIENGQETVLWYDPVDPTDDERIVVRLQREHPAP